MKKTMRKITCALLATISALGCAATMTACETAQPEVSIEIAFNGENYSLNYTLERSIAPRTVAHFLWLADNGYYDGLCVHDYNTANSRMYTGAYKASESDATSLVYKKYYDTIATYDNYKEFPHSVWFDVEKKDPAYTLRGEFSANNVTVEGGALQEEFGSLAMYYNDISSETVAKQDVFTVREDREELGKADYQENSVTSMFFISLTSAAKSNTDYCTFARLDQDSVEELQDLQDAIAQFIKDNYEDNSDNFTETLSMPVIEEDGRFEDSATINYNAPKEAIVITEVNVEKY